jgi:hypothetical protein
VPDPGDGLVFCVSGTPMLGRKLCPHLVWTQHLKFLILDFADV